MKRLFILFFVTSLLIMSLAASAMAQSFTNFDADVPSDWTATENESGAVTMVNSNSSYVIIIYVAPLGGQTLQQVAEKYYSDLNAANGLNRDESGFYSFRNTNSNGVSFWNFVEDHSVLKNIPQGYYAFFSMTLEDSTTEIFFNTVYKSMLYHPDSSVQYFSRIRLNVPSGWSASENEEGSMITLYDNSDSSLYISFIIDVMDGSSLYDITQEYCSNLNGRNLRRNEEYGYYYFTFINDYGNPVGVIVEDNTTLGAVPSGYYFLTAIVLSVSKEVMNNISFAITVSDQIDKGRGTSNNEDGTNNDGLRNHDFGGENGDSGGSSGCNSGFGALIPAVLGLALIGRKHR